MKRLIAIIVTAILLLSLLAACSAADRLPTVNELLSLGEQFLLDGDYEQALIQFMLAIEVDPMNPRGYTGAAEAYVGLGDHASAMEVLEDGLRAVGDDASIRIMLEDIRRAEEERWQAEIEAEVEWSLVEIEEELERSIEISVSYIIEPRFDFDDVFPFSEGLAGVAYYSVRETRLGYITKYGEIAIPIEHNFRGTVYPFSEGRVIIHSNDYQHYREYIGGTIGIFDTEGRQIVPFREYLGGIPFSEGLAIMYTGRRGAQWSILIDLDGNQYDLLNENVDNFIGFGSFSEGLAIVRTGERFEFGSEVESAGFVDRNGNVVIAPQFDSVRNFSEGLAAFRQRDIQTGRWGFIDRSGSVVIQPRFFNQPAPRTRLPVTRNALKFSSGRAVVHNEEGQAGVIDTSGEIVIPFGQYYWINDFSEGFSTVIADSPATEGSPIGVIDVDGNIVIPFGKYGWIGNFSNGLAAVRIIQNNVTVWGFVDRNGNIIVELRYSDVRDFSEGLAWVNAGTRENPLWGILQIDNFANTP